MTTKRNLYKWLRDSLTGANDMAKITVMIPCYNEEEGIGAVLKSIPHKEFSALGHSIETLINRLKKRKTEKEIDIEHRIKRAKEEFELSKYYDYIIENDKIDVTLRKVSDVINKEIFITK